MAKVNYNRRLYRNYHRGRAMSQDTAARWAAAISHYKKIADQDIVLDLGSGTGRFSTFLADHFNGTIASWHK